MNEKYIIANVGEIYLKGNNIKFFEDKLISNLKLKINLQNLTEKVNFTKKHGGSIYIKLSNDISISDFDNLIEIIKTTPGIVNFYIADAIKSDFSIMLKEIPKIAQKAIKKLEDNNIIINTFAVRTTRTWKSFEKKSNELNVEIGSSIWKKIKKDVNLSKPDITIFIKVTNEKTFVYTEKIETLGGLPISSSGHSLTFLSGGIDSPVSSFLAMNRGLKITALHFHSVPQTSPKSIEKVKSLVKELSKFQTSIKLYLIPTIPFQKAIAENCSQKLRIILQRRIMIEIAEIISKKENTQGFITGDSLGQVASQTIENLTAVSEISNQLIIRPLIGLDKNDIIKIAKKINTYETSIIPHEDTCGAFAPKKPETRAKLNEVISEHNKIPNLKEIIDEVLNKTEIIEISYYKK